MEPTDQSTVTETPLVEPAPTPAPTPTKKSRAAGLFLDFILIATTASLLAGSAWYLNKQMKSYHIPTALELAMEENAKLSQLQQTLEEGAFKADQQNRLNQHFTQLQQQLDKVDEAVSKKKGQIDTAKRKILALQHQIRQSDREARNIARNQLMPGMMLGVIKTKKGTVYNGAVIRGLEGKRITIRHDSGQARFDVSLLQTENLPILARYGLGLDNLVDMSDFSSTQELTPNDAEKNNEQKKEEQAQKNQSVSKKPETRTRSFASYDPKPGLPVVDSTRQKTSGGSADMSSPSNVNIWDAPDDPLPL